VAKFFCSDDGGHWESDMERANDGPPDFMRQQHLSANRPGSM
jgi:hypothetical protein